MSVFVYLLSIVFQLSGGIILLVNNIKLSPQRLGEEYCAGNIMIRLDEKTQKIVIDSKRLEGLLLNVFLNRTAFILLILGYGINIVGDIGCFNRWLAAMIIVVASIILSYASYKICCGKAETASRSEKYKTLVRENIPNDTVAMSNEL